MLIFLNRVKNELIHGRVELSSRDRSARRRLIEGTVGPMSPTLHLVGKIADTQKGAGERCELVGTHRHTAYIGRVRRGIEDNVGLRR